MKKIGNIYEETNYDVFRRLLDNRDVLQGRHDQILASISEKYVLNPIIVNEKMEIIDGQGRYEARKTLGLPIHYIVVPGVNSDDCKRMNKFNSTWSRLDFAKSYAKAGKQPYILLLMTCKKTGLSITRVLRLSNHAAKENSHRKIALGIFERGGLCFTAEDSLIVQEVNKMAEEITDALQTSYRRNDAFYTAVKILSDTKGYNHDRMLKNSRVCRSSYAQMAKLRDQLVEFERIYNYNTQKGNRLYFSDYIKTRGYNVRTYEPTSSPYTEKDISTLKEVRA